MLDVQTEVKPVTEEAAPSRKIHIELSVLKKQGLLVDLSISGTSMFQRSLSWIESGIAEFSGDPRVVQFTRGQKFVWRAADVRELKSVEVAVRQLLDKYTYVIDGFYPYRWLPVTAYKTWRERHDALVVRAMSIKARMIADRDGVVDEIAASYTEIALLAWESIAKTGEFVVIENAKTGERVPFDRDGFVDYIVSSTVAAIPTQAEIEGKLEFDYVTAVIETESDLAKDYADAQRIRTQAVTEKEIASLEVRAKTEEVRARVWEIQTAQREREVIIDAMREAEIEHARSQIKNMVSPFAEVFSALRSQFAADASEILESVKRNGFVRGKVAERGRGLLEMFDLMAVQDDSELRSRLVELRTILGPVSDTRPVRNPEEISGMLREIMALERRAAEDLSAGPDRFSMLEV